MAGNTSAPNDHWIQDRLHVQGPWVETMVIYDLNFWADPISCAGRKTPSVRELAKVYGWSRGRLRRWLEAREAEPTAGPVAAHPEPKRGPADEGAPLVIPPPEPKRGPPPAHPEPTAGPGRNGTRAVPSPSPSPSPSLPPKAPQGDSLPAWARKAKRPKGVQSADILKAVVSIKAAITGSADANRCASDSKLILALWKALERPPLPQLVAEMTLIAEAARDCGDGLFAQDIRGEGRDDGVDRSRAVGTLCVQKRFGDRLRAAQAWEGKGRPKRNGYAVDHSVAAEKAWIHASTQLIQRAKLPEPLHPEADKAQALGDALRAVGGFTRFKQGTEFELRNHKKTFITAFRDSMRTVQGNRP